MPRNDTGKDKKIAQSTGTNQTFVRIRAQDLKTLAKELNGRTEAISGRIRKLDQARVIKQKLLDREVSI